MLLIYDTATNTEQLLYLFKTVDLYVQLLWLSKFYKLTNVFVHTKLFVFAATLSAKIGGARKLIFEQKEWKSGPIACLDWTNFYSNTVIFIQIYQIIASQCSRQKKEKE